MEDEKWLKHNQIQSYIINMYILVNRNDFGCLIIYVWVSVVVVC